MHTAQTHSTTTTQVLTACATSIFKDSHILCQQEDLGTFFSCAKVVHVF